MAVRIWQMVITFLVAFSSVSLRAGVGGDVAREFLQKLQRGSVALQGGGVGNYCAGVLISGNAVLSSARCVNAQKVVFSNGSMATIDFSVAHPNYSLITGQTIDDLESQSNAVNDIAIFHFVGAVPVDSPSFGWYLQDVEAFPVSTTDGKSFSYFTSWGKSFAFLGGSRQESH